MTYKQAEQKGEHLLQEAGVMDAKIDAWLLLEVLEMEEDLRQSPCWEQKQYRWEHVLSWQMSPLSMIIIKKEL